MKLPDTIRLALVDDDPEEPVIVRALLGEIGDCRYALDWFPDHGAALAGLGDARHDVCLIDYRLGAVTGLELMRGLRGAGIAVPVILLTSDTSRATDMAAMAEGAADFLVKRDLSPGLLERSIRYTLHRARLEADIRRLSLHDSLTGLGNRRLLDDHLTHLAARARRKALTYHVVYLDLDGFKAINDTYGHAAGDHVLVATAERLLTGVRESDLVIRLGGDEFVLVLEDLPDPREFQVLLSRLARRLEAPVVLPGGGVVRVGASLGTASSPDGACDPMRLLMQADAAMFARKAQRRGRPS